ncbi:hypothetical protein CU669_20405 [Paramagnetospirillum kuznetsovii]|uniref:Prohead serine protease domain-containing protein n=1 Tax=Paramagnetospirillum kuznetsovii TaxID=2053833 RepID=A0A364NSS4_9PROT|nr:HK97 family phage prohead protease [Paramagnetospirillum kuznetsovii]RAU20070.1 hypothetical protein CU669_20405 [Paramagnetospirillum kuznetsovii]
MNNVNKDLVATVKAATAANGNRQVRVIASTAAVDRAGDVVDPNGWELGPYRKNPTVLWAHDHDRVIGRTIDIGVTNGRLEATIEFLKAGVSTTADIVYQQVLEGAVNTVSVGFLPITSTPIATGRKFTKAELMEISFCAVPANAEALVIGKTMTPTDRAAELRALRARVEREDRAAEIAEMRRADGGIIRKIAPKGLAWRGK